MNNTCRALTALDSSRVERVDCLHLCTCGSCPLTRCCSQTLQARLQALEVNALAQQQAQLQQELDKAQSRLQQADETANQQLQDIQNKKQRVAAQTDSKQIKAEADARRKGEAAMTVSCC